MTLYLANARVIGEGDEEKVRVDFTDWLVSGETISSVDTPAEQDTDDLTIANEAPNAATYVDPYRRDADGDLITVAIGKAVEFDVSGQLASEGKYHIEFTVTSSASRKKKVGLVLLVE